nr:thioredoxin-like 1-1, chloroplastic [Ipomoea batatas]
MADVLSKTAGVVFSPSSVDCKSAIHHHHHHTQHRVCDFPNRSENFFSSLNLRCTNRNLPSTDFCGGGVALRRERDTTGVGSRQAIPSSAPMSIGLRKAPKWWEKGLQPNMKEVTGAQDLVDSLLNAGDKLVVVDFFSPGCGGCKALHPKICQLAEMNPDVQFLQVNYEEHKSMCYSLNVHVLPFFRFYRGAEGRVCSFSCTNATIKKFKDALVKYGTYRCSLGPPKGLEEKELLALTSNRDLSFEYTPKGEPSPAPSREEITIGKSSSSSSSNPNSEFQLPLPLPIPLATSQKVNQESGDKAIASPSPR